MDYQSIFSLLWGKFSSSPIEVAKEIEWKVNDYTIENI